MTNNAVRSRKNFQNFQEDIRSPRVQGLLRVSLHPAINSIHAFTISAERAVELKPDLLSVNDPDSLIAAIVECASYGFYCDGEQGYIEAFNSKVSSKPDVYQRIARYELQAAGIRAVGMRNGIVINSQVVYEKDNFEHHEGDDGRIVHELNWKAGKDRGNMYCSYAIFRRATDGFVLHREVMDEAMIENARSQSRNKDALMWTKFKEEGWKKTVIRRGSKTVPLDAMTQRAARQVDRHYGFDDKPEGSVLGEAEEETQNEGENSSSSEEKASPKVNNDKKENSKAKKDGASGGNAGNSGKSKSKAVDKKPPTKKLSPAKKVAAKKTTKANSKSPPQMSSEDVKVRFDLIEDEIFNAEDIDSLQVISDREAQFLADYDNEGIINGMIEIQRQNLE